MYVKPAPNRQVRMPYPPYPLMPEAGGNVPMNPYWSRRLVAGDVVFADDPTKGAPPSRDADETPEPTRKVKGKGSKE